MKTFLGFDTSNYKTSCALVREDGTILRDERKFLTVRPGGRGLRQQEALFQHVQALPDLVAKLFQGLAPEERAELSAVACSVRPRPVEGSYMPVFTAGRGAAVTIASALDIPCYAFSHQEGHVAAAAKDQLPEDTEPFLVFHFSGGTTEGLLARRTRAGYQLEKVAATKDLAFGQVIDRVGVALGWPFPAGEYVDRAAMACQTPGEPLARLRVVGGGINLSGIESQAQRRIQAGEAPDVLCRAVMDAVCEGVRKLTAWAAEETGVRRVLLSGGVSSSQYLRTSLHAEEKLQVWFGEPSLCQDNAVGIALLGGMMYAAEADHRFTAE